MQQTQEYVTLKSHFTKLSPKMGTSTYRPEYTSEQINIGILRTYHFTSLPTELGTHADHAFGILRESAQALAIRPATQPRGRSSPENGTPVHNRNSYKAA